MNKKNLESVFYLVCNTYICKKRKMHKIFKILEDKILNECGLIVMNLPAVQETRVQSLDREDPLEKEMTTHSSILVWKIPWTEEPHRL